jgi:hypothetical protein
MELEDYQKVGKIVLDEISNENFLTILKKEKDDFRFV